MSFATGHALLIGVGSHKHLSHLDVPITVADANAVNDVLADEDACGFLSENIRLIHDEQATKDNLLAEIYDLAERVTAQDTAVIFYCGHGALGEDGNFYLVTHDATQNGRGKIRANTGVSQEALTKAVNKIKAQKLLLIFNACHSGHIEGTLSDMAVPLKTLHPSGNALNALLGTGEGRVIIVAAKKKQYSVIGSGDTTLFTTALVEGLEGEDVRNNGGYIDVYDLYQKIYRDVKQQAAQFGHQQEPLLTCLDVAGSFPIALYKGANPQTMGMAYTPEPLPSGSEGNVTAVSPRKAERIYRGVVPQVNTGGGAYIVGSVNTGGGDFIGRDQNIGGDYVRGNKYGGDHIEGNKTTLGDGSIHGEHITINQYGRQEGTNPELGDLPPIPPNLRNNMRERLSVTDVKGICFDMEVSYDALSSGAFYDKINALVQYSRQHGRVDELIHLCNDYNSTVDWRS